MNKKKVEELTKADVYDICNVYTNLCRNKNVMSNVFELKIRVDEDRIPYQIDIGASMNPLFNDPFGKRDDIVLDCIDRASKNYDVDIHYELDGDQVFFSIVTKGEEVYESII